MNTALRTSAKAVAAIMLASATLAGCGGDDDETAAAPTSAAATSSTTSADEQAAPQEKKAKPTGKGNSTEQWVDQLCVNLKNEVKALNPPEVSPSTPEQTRDSLVAFYDRILDRFEVQERVITDLGSPPGTGADKVYDRALKALRRTSGELSKAADEVKASNPKTPEDVGKLMKSLEDKMTSLSSYKGPLIELTDNKKLSDAINANATCNEVG